MEDFPILLLFLIFYLVAASTGRKKKSTQKVASRRDSRRDPRMILQEKLAQKRFGEEMQDEDGGKRPDAHAPCDAQKMYLHEVTQQQFAEAAEGEDPCHAGGQTPLEETCFDAFQMEDSEAFAQDVLRGVIMSEILTRPCERQAMQRKGFR